MPRPRFCLPVFSGNIWFFPIFLFQFSFVHWAYIVDWGDAISFAGVPTIRTKSANGLVMGVVLAAAWMARGTVSFLAEIVVIFLLISNSYSLPISRMVLLLTDTIKIFFLTIPGFHWIALGLSTIISLFISKI